MKGQKLFVRPIETADLPAVTEFLQRESPVSTPPRAGLLGKLAGSLVAVLAMELTEDAVSVRDLVVARELRRKRIGGFMVDEVYALAAKMERPRLVMDCNGPREFLERAGFTKEGNQMVRRVVR